MTPDADTITNVSGLVGAGGGAASAIISALILWIGRNYMAEHKELKTKVETLKQETDDSVSALQKEMVGKMEAIKGALDTATQMFAKANSEQAAALTGFQVYVANTYTKETNIQSSLERIHNRMDKMQESQDRQSETLQTDLKQILLAVNNSKS